MPTKNFYRKCEMCCYECKNASNWSKHTNTLKHKRNKELETEERIRRLVAIELLKIGIQPPVELPTNDNRDICVYCILVGEDKYVGHSINLKKRMKSHKSQSSTSDVLLYKTIREYGGWDMVEVEELANYYNRSLKEACEMETIHFYEVKPSLNSCVPSNPNLINPYIKQLDIPLGET